MLLSCRLIPPLTPPAGSLPFPAWSVRGISPAHGPEQPLGSRVRCVGLMRCQGGVTALPPSERGGGAVAEGARGGNGPPGRAGGPAGGDSLVAAGGRVAE